MRLEITWIISYLKPSLEGKVSLCTWLVNHLLCRPSLPWTCRDLLPLPPEGTTVLSLNLFFMVQIRKIQSVMHHWLCWPNSGPKFIVPFGLFTLWYLRIWMNSGPLVHYLPFFSAAIAIDFCSWRQVFSFPSHPPPLDIFIWSPRMNGLDGWEGRHSGVQWWSTCIACTRGLVTTRRRKTLERANPPVKY